MDYEKKYKEALGRAKEQLEGAKVFDYKEGQIAHDIRTTTYAIFPELKDADELTWLTKYIEEEAYSLSMDIRDNEDRVKLKNLKRSLAWLEKQGEKPQRMVSAEAKEALYDKPAWSEEDEVRLQACLDTLQAKSLFGVVDTVMTEWLKQLKQRIGGNV